MSFIIFGLPRSGTYWLSVALSHSGWECYHDRSVWMRTQADIAAWAGQPLTGTVETTGMGFWRYLRRVAPNVRLATLRRPVSECAESWARLTGQDAERVLRRLDSKLDQLEARVQGVLRIEHDEMFELSEGRRICRELQQREVDPEWWTGLAARRLSTSVPAQQRYISANLPAIEKLRTQLKQAELSAMAQRAVREGALTLAEESFDPERFAEALSAVREHMLATDQGIEDFREKNIPLFMQLQTLGILRTHSARANGKVVGYLLTVISPSLESPHSRIAEHSSFFINPVWVGAGAKLLRFAESNLRSEGITEFQARAGIRGSGPRMGKLYSRLGYADFGQLYRKEA